ncbi:hypothetical protein HOY80DRAFT_1047951 [Tuber brumale]|nr:hypothetical protein HOY80DRAFT_1047951 [Tuber brumale]
MGFPKSHSSVKDSLMTAMVFQKSVEKTRALKLENSKLRQHVSVLYRRLHEVIAVLKLWMERVVEKERRSEKVEFAGSVNVMPLEMEEEVAVVEEIQIVVRLPVGVVELVAWAGKAEDVAMVEVAGKGKEVAVVAEGAEDGVSSGAEDWTVVKRKVRERGKSRRRRELEEKRDTVRKRMNVWRPAKVVVPNAPFGPRVGGEGVERMGEEVVPQELLDAPMGPRAYRGVMLCCEMRKSFRGLGSVPEKRKVYAPDSSRGLVVYGGVRDWQGLGRNGHCGTGWYCRNQDEYLT